MTRADLIDPKPPSRAADIDDFDEDDDGGYWSYASRTTKERVTVRFDRDVLAFFRRSGKGYQTRMNAALRAYMRTLDQAENRAADQANKPGG